jgi:hypothetical protein
MTCLNPEYPITADPLDGSGPCVHLDVFLFFVALGKLDLNGVDYALARWAMADGSERLVESVADFYSETHVGRELIQRGRELGSQDLTSSMLPGTERGADLHVRRVERAPGLDRACEGQHRFGL